jgi:hypothetical protein
LYVPQVGQAVCCNLGCWHWPHVERAAAVVFHWLRRERVFERDIFRFGTGTVLTSSQSFGGSMAAEGKYPSKGLNLEIGVLEVESLKAGPSGIDRLVCVILGQLSPFAPAFGAQA